VVLGVDGVFDVDAVVAGERFEKNSEGGPVDASAADGVFLFFCFFFGFD
jgi:hypothetical protein